MIDFEVIDINDFYNLEEKEQEKYIENVKKAIKKTNNELIKKMDRIVKRNVKNYITDFYLHDLYIIKKYKSPFLWMTRSSGTDLIPLKNLDKNLIVWYHCTKKINKNFYYYNGKTLKKISMEEMEKLITKYQ